MAGLMDIVALALVTRRGGGDAVSSSPELERSERSIHISALYNA
jgi:hypothetical protein